MVGKRGAVPLLDVGSGSEHHIALADFHRTAVQGHVVAAGGIHTVFRKGPGSDFIHRAGGVVFLVVGIGDGNGQDSTVGQGL